MSVVDEEDMVDPIPAPVVDEPVIKSPTKVKKPRVRKIADPESEEKEQQLQLQEQEQDDVVIVPKKSKAKKSKAIKADDEDDDIEPKYDAKLDKKYQKQDPRGHVEMRPSRYVGSVQCRKRVTWVAIPWSETMEGIQAASLAAAEALDRPEHIDEDAKAVIPAEHSVPQGPLRCLLRRTELYSARGFLTIFREPLCNALDNSSKPGSKMTYIKIMVDPIKRRIVIENDGPSINVTQKSTTHKMYYPELVFAHMHTSENYDDTQERKTGGRHGEGVKLTSILSLRSSVEINDPDNDRNYNQTFEDRLKVIHPPTLTKAKKKKHYIRFSFEPDLSIFGMQEMGFNNDIMGMMRASACEAAATAARKGIKVSFNGEWLSIRSFTEYADACVRGMGGFGEMTQIFR